MSKDASRYTGVNHRGVKQSNRSMILRAVRALGPIARVDLAQRTGLNPGTVSNIVDDLIAGELVTETGYVPVKRAGRRPVHLEINASARYAIGVDLARTSVTGALVDLTGQPRRRVTKTNSHWDTAPAAASAVVQRLLDQLSPQERSSLVGIGIGVPSPAGAGGSYLSPESFDNWERLGLAEELERRHGMRTYVDNNANTAALAELWFGAGRDMRNFVLLNLGTGIGSGLILDGDLYRGDHDIAGEAGHISVNLDGPACRCGNRGCLETYVSVPRVLAAVRSALDAGQTSTHLSSAATNHLTIDQVIGALHADDPLTVRIFADLARYLAAGIVNIIYTLDPQLILLGRELSAAGDVLVEPVRQEVERRMFPAMRNAVEIRVGTVHEAPVIGAATLALSEFFAAPLMTQEPLPTAADPNPQAPPTRGSLSPFKGDIRR